MLQQRDQPSRDVAGISWVAALITRKPERLPLLHRAAHLISKILPLHLRSIDTNHARYQCCVMGGDDLLLGAEFRFAVNVNRIRRCILSVRPSRPIEDVTGRGGSEETANSLSL